MIGIYKITNPSGKVYIGSSIDIKYRTKYYKNINCRGQVKLYNSLAKYGWNAHLFEILEECEVEMLYIRERFYGDLYKVLGENGLNLILPCIGENKVGVSESTRLKMSLAHKGELNHQFGKPLSIERRERIRIFQTGRKHTAEHRRKVSLNNAKNLSKPVINIETGIYYDSIKDASIALCQIHSSLKNRVNGHSPTYTPIKII